MGRILLATAYFIIVAVLILTVCDIWAWPAILGIDWPYWAVAIAFVIFFLIGTRLYGIIQLVWFGIPINKIGKGRSILYTGAIVTLLMTLCYNLYNLWTTNVEFTIPRILIAALLTFAMLHYSYVAYIILTKLQRMKSFEELLEDMGSDDNPPQKLPQKKTGK